MKLLILPGQDKRNQQWCQNLERKVSDRFICTSVVYPHWERGGQMRFDSALRSVPNIGSCFVCAKSAGVILALLAIISGDIKPKSCVFIGVPLRWEGAEDFDLTAMIQQLLCPKIIIQNQDDPLGGANDVKYLGAKLIILEGETHEYDNFEMIAKTLFSIV